MAAAPSRTRLRRLLRLAARRTTAPVAPSDHDPFGADTGVVHALLTPRGLVRANGVIVPGWWVGDGPAPEPGTEVRRRESRDGRWLAEAVGGEPPA